MENLQKLLDKMKNSEESHTLWDIKFTIISKQYSKIETVLSVDPSKTVEDFLQSRYPKEIFIAFGYGIYTNGKPQSMTWKDTTEIMKTNIKDLWTTTTLSHDQKYLIICNSFPKRQYRKDMLLLEDQMRNMKYVEDYIPH